MSVFTVREEEFADYLSSQVSFLGSTPLHYASLADSADTIRALMDYKANPNMENEFGHTPFDYIKDSPDKGMINLMEDFKKYSSEYENFIW